MTVSLIDLQLPFVLAFLGRIEIAETLAVAIVTEIIGAIVTYSVKSFFETREEEKINLEKQKIEQDLTLININDGGSEG